MGRVDGARAIVLVIDDGDEITLWQGDRPGRRPDLALVNSLARLQLEARRLGWTIRLHNPCADLHALLDLVGLADLVHLDEGHPARGSPLPP